MKLRELISEDWSTKYKRSIDCDNPKGFSQRAHCQGRKKNEDLNDNDPRNQIWYGGNNDPDGPRTHQDYRVTDKIDFEGLPAGLIYKIRKDAMLIPSGLKGKEATEKFYKKYKKYLKPHHAADTKKESAGDRGDIPTGPGEQLIPFPAGTTMIDVSDAYDWYKLGMVISDLDDADPKIFGQGAPHTAIVFGSEEEEHKLLPLLKRLGLSVHDIDTPQDVKKAIPAKALIQRMEENFAEDSEECPPATQDIKLNLENRQKAIDEYGYGPLNPDLPNTKFWLKKVDEWNLDSASEAKQSLCGNCAAFDVRQKTLDCIAKGIDSENSQDAEAVIDAGELGYCKFLKFKCASRRTCDAWVTGGPLTDQQGVAEGSKSQYIAARYIDEFADGEHWYVKGSPEVIQRFVQLANSLEDESVKGTEYEPGKGMMAKIHANLGDDSIPQWEIVNAQNLEGLKPIGNKVLQLLMNPDLSDGVEEFMSEFLWTLEEKGLASVTNEPQQGLSEGYNKAVISEAREAPLYHFTTWNNLIYIISGNELKSPGGKIYLTRDYSRQFIPHKEKLFNQPYGIRLNQDLLSRDYGKKLQAGGQDVGWDEKKRQAWLSDPKNADEIEKIKRTGQGGGLQVRGVNPRDIVKGTITRTRRWESEEHLNVKSVPNVNKYITGIVIGEILGQEHSSLVVDADPLTKLADVLIHLFAGDKTFKQRDWLLDSATKLNVPIIYKRKEFDPIEVKKRIIQLYSQRKKEREEEKSKTKQTFMFITNKAGGGFMFDASDIPAAFRELSKDFKFKDRIIYGYSIGYDPKAEKTMFDKPGTPVELLKTLNVQKENFADGRNPQDKGDSARHGIRKGMSIAQLKKIRSSDTASARKKQLAHWQINMRQGKKK